MQHEFYDTEQEADARIRQHHKAGREAYWECTNLDPSCPGRFTVYSRAAKR